MDRNILTIGEQFDAADFDQTNKNAYVGLAKLAYAILGTSTLLNGFTCTQNSIPNLNVLIGPGEIYQMAAIDTTPYGDLPVDSHIIFKQGVNLDALPGGTLTFDVPTTPGDSVNYLIEFALQESDINDENREFYNASPQVVPTIRQDSVFIKALAGTPAPTGTQTTPAPEAGFVGGFVVTIAYGQTTITNGDISVYASAPFITEKLKDKISQTTADARYGRLAVANTWTQRQYMPAVVGGTYMSAGQSLAAGVATKVDFDTVDFDPLSLWDATNKRFTLTAGFWRINGILKCSSTSSVSSLWIMVYVNGSEVRQICEMVSGAGPDVTLSGDTIVNVANGDYVEIYAEQDVSGAGTITIGATVNSAFQVEFLGT